MPTRAKNVGCVHHWAIEVANGPVSNGTCKHCGEEKDFENSIFEETRHITLAKESGNAEREEKGRRWNPYTGS